MVSQIKFSESDEGYLIRSVDFGEDHRILSFLTRHHGRLEAIALAAKKSTRRFGPTLDFFNRLRLEYQIPKQGDLARLAGADLVGSHPRVRGDYQRSIIGLTWMRELSQITLGAEPLPELFFQLERHLDRLGSDSPEGVDLSWHFHLLDVLGYRLELMRCAKCQRREGGAATFVGSEGGLVCSACHAPKPFEIRAAFFPAQWDDDLADKKERKRVLSAALEYYLGIPLEERKTTRNHSQGFRVVGRKVGGLKNGKND